MVALSGCTGSSDTGDAGTDPPCVTGLTASCAATYAPPTFDTIFTNIFQPNCAVGTGTCHTSDFAAGGIVFADAGAAYATLLGADGGTPYVLPDNPGCSTLMKRLESSDPSYHMPRGPTSLSDGDLCTIVQWIDEGAPP
jgi:Planctomycete cytochrome C